jgi:hypothetical protein
MSKSRTKIDSQYSLFDLISRLQDHSANPGPGSLNIQYQLRGIISECIKRCPLTRWEIAGSMSALLNQEVSKYMLDTWTAESKEYHRFPAEYLPAFCQTVGSYEPLRFLAEKAGVFLLPGPEALRAEIKKIEEEIRKLHKKRQKRMAFLEEMATEKQRGPSKRR